MGHFRSQLYVCGTQPRLYECLNNTPMYYIMMATQEDYDRIQKDIDNLREDLKDVREGFARARAMLRPK